MKNIKLIMVLTVIFALLIIPGEAFATVEDYDLGIREGKAFYGIDSSFSDYDGAFLEYARSEKYDEIESQIEDNSDFRRGFKKGYEDALKGDVDINYAKALGESLGKTLALEDFHNRRDSDWRKAIPTDNNIVRMYNVDDMPESYEIAFILEFKIAFQKGYEDAYEEALLDPPKMSMEQGLKDGKDVGVAMGIIAAETDYLYKKTMDDERDLLSEAEIRERYRLRLGNYEYEDAFIQSFSREYKRAYNEKFRELSQGDSLLKSVSTTILPAGGEFGVGDNVTLSVKPGTFYMPLIATLNTRNTDFYSLGTYVRASEIYGLRIENPAGTLDDNKPIRVSFPYYGDKNKAGLYKLVDDRWSYVPSRVEEDLIFAEVLPSTLSNRESVFAVFMDNSIRVLTDVRDHWAKDEIQTMVRRDIIKGYPGETYLDGTFKPEQNITRAEFLILLSRAENWTLPSYIENATYFKDYKQFQNYGNIISYGLSKGHVIGYPDRTFRPFNPISYYEVELIMGRVLNNYN
ncbi:MAG TPA: S-layer homology domain-containing protein, partial [Tissierellaceae bacterium]|nr:S-layer homology domain-containing protein [Tissierellaceae bacterium]